MEYVLDIQITKSIQLPIIFYMTANSETLTYF